MSTSSWCRFAMIDASPTPPARPKSKHASIRAKILLALLCLSMFPLVLFVALSLYGVTNAEGYIRTRLIHESQRDMSRLVKVQADVADEMLDKVEAQTQMIVYFAQELMSDPAAFDRSRTRSYSTEEKPDDPSKATKYVLAPGVSLAAARPALDLTSNLDGLFESIKKGDRYLGDVYIGTESGVYRQYPWDDDPEYIFAFTLDPTIAPPSEDGTLPESLRKAFKNNGVDVAPDAAITTVDPSNAWAVLDEQKQTFILRRQKTGLAVYLGYDPRQRPWYREAIDQSGVVWTIYRGWLGGDNYAFSLEKGLESQLTNTVSPGLEQAFAQHQIPLVVGSPISVVGDVWAFLDKNENNFAIRKEDGRLNVYDLDILTCSRAVLDRQGRLAGVVGLDVNMASLRKRIIHTQAGIDAYVFMLNDKGDLVDQERPDMFVPPAGGAIRSKMAAGETGQVFDEASRNWIFYAPIQSIRSKEAKTVWSLGMSVPEGMITRLAKDTQRRLFFVVEMGVLLFFAVMPLPMFYALIRTSRAIAGPILQLGEGVKRIGGGNLEYRVNVKTNDEIEELGDAFNKMAGDLQTYIKDLKKTTAEKERFESELRVAHDIQMSFLKKIFPPFPHRDDFSLYASIKPAREVGGDLYDFALLDDSRLFFYIGDVSDKGVPASLIMAITMTLMKRASLQPSITPAAILHQVNVTLAEENENLMFVTLFVGILNIATGELAFSNAGHNPPLILSADGECRFLKLPDGLVLGVMAETEYHDAMVILGPGDMVVAYTDGVTEAMNTKEELYSESRLQKTLARLGGRSVQDTVGAIFASVQAHAAGAPQSDDIAVLAVRRNRDADVRR